MLMTDRNIGEPHGLLATRRAEADRIAEQVRHRQIGELPLLALPVAVTVAVIVLEAMRRSNQLAFLTTAIAHFVIACLALVLATLYLRKRDFVSRGMHLLVVLLIVMAPGFVMLSGLRGRQALGAFLVLVGICLLALYLVPGTTMVSRKKVATGVAAEVMNDEAKRSVVLALARADAATTVAISEISGLTVDEVSPAVSSLVENQWLIEEGKGNPRVMPATALWAAARNYLAELQAARRGAPPSWSAAKE